MAGKGKQTIGYWYWMTVHMGLGRGPVNGITEISAGDRTAWEGHVTENSTIQINAENLWGGEEREGGIVGTLEVLMGGATQVAPAWFKTLLGGFVPGFRGVVSCIFDGKLAAMNPYPKPWKFRRWRTTAGWFNNAPWNPATATIELGGEGAVGKNLIRAMNPAHIIYECCTNPQWGRGLDPLQIDQASFTAAADILYTEKFGLCINWAREDDISPFIQHIIDTIGGALYVSRLTGLVTLDLIRGGYDPDSLLLFDYESGLLSVEEDSGNSQDTSFSEIVVKGHDPITDKDFEVRSQNIAAREAHGSAISTTAEYPGIPTRDLAARVADRDLIAQTGLKPYKVKLDRRGWRLTPGGVFRISAPDRGIANLVLRIGTISEPDIRSGEITLGCIVDVFSLRANSFHEPVPPSWRPPSQEAVPVAEQEIVEASYRDLTRALPASELALLDADAAYIYTVAALPSSDSILLNYTLATKIDAEGFQRYGTGQFAPSGRLAADITPLQTAVVLDNLSQWEADVDYTGMAALLGDEYVRIDAYDTTTGAFTLARGCVDTIPVEHSAGTRLYLVDDETATDGREYATAETVFAKLLTNTTADQLTEAEAPTVQVTVDQRQARPYPPGDVTLNGDDIETIPGGDYTVPLALAWTHRDRLLQDDQLIDHTAASIGPEPGVTYTVVVYNTDGSGEEPIHTETGITGTSFTYDEAMYLANGEPLITRLELWAVRDGLRSRETYSFAINALGSGTDILTIDGEAVTIDGEPVTVTP